LATSFCKERCHTSATFWEGEWQADKLIHGHDSELGIRLITIGIDGVIAELDVDTRHLQPGGIVHGGVYCSIVETVASLSGGKWLAAQGKVPGVVGVSNTTDFLRPVRSGTLTARSHPVFRGGSQHVWRVEITDQQGQLVAQGQVRLQVVRTMP
jgi:1,4-dihydroxy-2-naphthoyl-CoA hydrolase